MDQNEFKNHKENEHQMSQLATYIQECIYGGTDGIVTTFSVVAGFSGANLGDKTLDLSIITVLLFGIANLFADGAAMGLGNYLSIKSSQKLYENTYNKELKEVETSKPFEIKETEYIFKSQGFNDSDSKQLTSIISKNTDFWVRFMVQHECEIEDTTKVSPFKNGLATFISFIVFGSFPLIPYTFITGIDLSFFLSIGFTLFAMIMLGVLRTYLTKEKLYFSILETVAIGSTAASLAYCVGFVFRFI